MPISPGFSLWIEMSRGVHRSIQRGSGWTPSSPVNPEGSLRRALNTSVAAPASTRLLRAEPGQIRRLDNGNSKADTHPSVPQIMSALLFKRFLKRPMQVAYIVPSSKALIRRVVNKFDFSEPRIIVEFGPGEGCQTREILKRMHPESRLILFELDPEFTRHLEEQFKDEPRVEILNTDAQSLPDALAERGINHCDYVVSGIPFSILEGSKKKALLKKVYDSLTPDPHAAFIIYQVTNELRDRGHCDHFPRAESEYCLQNIPPMFVTKFYKQPLNGHVNGHANGHKHRSLKRH